MFDLPHSLLDGFMAAVDDSLSEMLIVWYRWVENPNVVVHLLKPPAPEPACPVLHPPECWCCIGKGFTVKWLEVGFGGHLWQTSNKRAAVTSQISLCLIDGKRPFGQDVLKGESFTTGTGCVSVLGLPAIVKSKSITECNFV